MKSLCKPGLGQGFGNTARDELGRVDFGLKNSETSDQPQYHIIKSNHKISKIKSLKGSDI